MFNWIKLIERNMRRNLRRTILTILTIALATFIYTVLVSVPASMDRVVKDASGTLRLIINNKTAPWEDLPARYCDDINKMPGVAACVAITGWPATWRDVSDPVFAVGAGPEIGDVFPDYALTGEERAGELERKARRNRRRRPDAQTRLEDRRHRHAAQHRRRSHGDDLHHHRADPSKRYPNTFLMRRDYMMAARKAHGLPDEDIAWNIIVRATSNDTLATLAKQIDEHFANSDAETRTMTESDALSSGLSAIGNIRAIVFALCLVVLLTVLLIAANSTVMMVREQISDVAVMRALGFSRGAVAVLLFGECATIGLLGGLIGAGAALWMFSGGITLGAALGGNGALWVTPAQTLNALIAALAVSLVSGVVPILEAVRLPPALAFRKVV